MIYGVKIYFANPDLVMKDHFDLIEEGCKKARRNLLGRHNIDILNVKNDGDGAIIDLEVPDDFGDINAGIRLKGIANYILNKHPDYREYCVGSRLFTYRILT